MICLKLKMMNQKVFWQIDFVGLRYTLVTLYRHYEVLLFIVDNKFGAADILKEDKTGDDDYRIEYFRVNIVEKKVVNQIKQVLEQVPA